MPSKTPTRPDLLAHQLVTNVGSPVRIHLQDSVATVPIEPCSGDSPATETVPVTSFDAVVEDAEIVDGGVNLFGINGLHLPESEWQRVGLQKHWEHPDADLESPLFPPQRTLELWASREDELHQFDDSTTADFGHLEGLPDDSPVLTEWLDNTPEDYPDRPPVPLSRPTVTVETVRAEGTSTTHGLHRVEVGTIDHITVLDDIYEQPTDPDIEARELPDFSSDSQHPDIEYDDIAPLAPEQDILDALQVINRHAKRCSTEATTAYRRNNGARARVHSVRKQALYRTKTVALHRLVKSHPDRIRIEHHDLEGKAPLLCVYVGEEHAFHQPKEALDDEVLEDVCGTATVADLDERTIDFTRSTETDSLPFTLEEAIGILVENGLNPNEHLAVTSVTDFDSGSQLPTTFTWSTEDD